TSVDAAEGGSGPTSITRISSPARARATVTASAPERAGAPPATFRLVDVRGRPNASTSPQATGFGLTRTPTPPVHGLRTPFGKIPSGSARTSVSAAGETASARRRAAGVQRRPSALSREGRSTRSGRSGGRPLISSTRATGPGSIAPPSPYTVSVG